VLTIVVVVIIVIVIVGIILSHTSLAGGEEGVGILGLADALELCGVVVLRRC
jgi:hypothetical protein